MAAREYLPIFWAAPELARLRGTQLAGRSQQDLPLLVEDFWSILVCACTRELESRCSHS